MNDQPRLKLGKHPATPDPTGLRLATYLHAAALPKPPATFGHENRMPQPRLMLGNGPDDSVQPGFQGAGNCVFAMICNAERLANSIAGRPVTFTGKEAIAAYSEVTGYRIGDDATDRGTDMRTALNWWRKETGIADTNGSRHKLGAYLALDLSNLHEQLEALYVLDIGVALGIVFPPTAMTEFDEEKPWSKTGRSDEGHAILWDAHRTDDVVETWARAQKATHGFIKAQADEAYAILTPEMLSGSGLSAEGLNLTQLQADLAALTA